MNSPIVIETDHNSVLLGWDICKDAVAYELQMRTSNTSNQDSEQDWQSLSVSIKSTSIRKKNLTSDIEYRYLMFTCQLFTNILH